MDFGCNLICSTHKKVSTALFRFTYFSFYGDIAEQKYVFSPVNKPIQTSRN